MTGFETVLLRVAGTAAGALVKSLLARAPGAGLVADPAAPAGRWRKPPTELGAAEIRRLTEVLAARLGPACVGLPEHERLAAVTAVGDTFAALGDLDAQTLFAADLDPAALAAALPAPPPGLSEAADALYRRLVALCCAHAVEYATTLPGFGARADVELVRRTGQLTRSLDRLHHAGDGSAHAFEERYAEYIARTHGRLQLFGLTLSRSRPEWPLDLAYISLAVSGARSPGEAPEPHRTSVDVKQALRGTDRVLLRGPAGSGKSTLIQWLALNAARRSFGPELSELNACVPFVLQLRSLRSREAAPMPEEFLRTAGVPLHGEAPAGWASALMRSGRALVLVDGVDEVPQHLRNQTEAWLWSLLGAYPQARYIVTTRPSAVPEDWLSGHGFSRTTLLPMERKEVRTFVSHWHDAARADCHSPDELAQLDRYEESLGQAVDSRRDLGRLATNPLMCALLCALNRDRHTHLPRARKELYDAALDMLLVRRDNEREISGVEGVDLTRDEQTLLLQRLAYWLIRNEHLEADRDEAVAMVAAWLDSMPRVRAQGTAQQVFNHLLIRSGLLIEPVPGAVQFVHRTFRDYLGAKAAVEARDFGVLVRHAHEDTWDDVVRMAVGHARPDERARLLRQLLRRADKVTSRRNRLVLLAAACLEHAPELDPEVWNEVRARTAELLPPRGPDQAEELAKAGEMVLELLPEPAGLSEAQAQATVRTAALVGGDRALQVIAAFRGDDRYEVGHELSDAWGRFPTADYADAVLAGAPMRTTHLHIRTPGQLAAFAGLPHIRRVYLTSDNGIPREITERRNLEWLVVEHNPGVADLSVLSGHRALRHLGVFDCPGVTSIEPVAELTADSLAFGYVQNGLSLAPLAGIPGLRSLVIGFEPKERHIGDVPAAEGLTKLTLWQGARGLSLDGLERWPALTSLAIAGDWQYGQFVGRRPLTGLTSLQIRYTAPVEVAHLLPYRRLTELMLLRCGLAGGLEQLRELPGLTRLRIAECAGTVDVAPLAGLDHLRLELDRRTAFTGTERIAPERLTFFS
ncbi:NACHT domain-containing protein [Streptomyces sp. NBC_00868]|uniref:NACHT domain-containing protein n=1 Tax=unclassified Streptomyces TaxID=2593676 RepID=UPI0032499244|nr:NACHT domain-containing protein [Streptomyces sp. NBC_00868]